jgi:hypothetical protein
MSELFVSILIDYLIIGVVIFTIGAIAGSRPMSNWVLSFFGVVLLWPIAAYGFLVGFYELIRGIIKTRSRRAK